MALVDLSIQVDAHDPIELEGIPADLAEKVIIATIESEAIENDDLAFSISEHMPLNYGDLEKDNADGWEG